MGKTLFIMACLAGEGFLIYCLIQFHLERERGRLRGHRETEDVVSWQSSPTVIPFSRDRRTARTKSTARAEAFAWSSADETITSIEARRHA